MNITVNNTTHIVEHDGSNWTLKSPRTTINPKTGEEKASFHTCYPASLRHACCIIADREAGKCQTLDEAIAVFRSMEKTSSDLEIKA